METAPRRKKASTLHTVVAPAGRETTIAALLEFNGAHVCYKRGEKHNTILARDGRDGLIWFIWFVLFIWLV